MNTRIKEVREREKLTQKAFGKRIGSARNTIANYETGNRKPSNAVINSICREFKINEEWLRNGTPPMEIPTTDKLSAYVTQICKEDDEFIEELLKAYMELDQDSRQALRTIAQKMAIPERERAIIPSFWRFFFD